jgi:hypothetical protein
MHKKKVDAKNEIHINLSSSVKMLKDRIYDTFLTCIRKNIYLLEDYKSCAE